MAPAAAGRVEKRRGKRAAEEELDGERRLRKKFGRLRLGMKAVFYPVFVLVPVSLAIDGLDRALKKRRRRTGWCFFPWEKIWGSF